MDIDTLYPLVTEAIRRAEVLHELAAPGAASAHLDVSLLEERIARMLPASDSEGAIARRGAVQAAIAAGEPARAKTLASHYLVEAGDDSALSQDLRALLKQADASAPDGERSPAWVSDSGKPVSAGRVPGSPATAAPRRGASRVGSSKQEVTLRSDLSAAELMEAIVRELKKSGKFTLPSFGTFSVRAERVGKVHTRTTGSAPPKEEKTVHFDAAPALKKAV